MNFEYPDAVTFSHMDPDIRLSSIEFDSDYEWRLWPYEFNLASVKLNYSDGKSFIFENLEREMYH